MTARRERARRTDRAPSADETAVHASAVALRVGPEWRAVLFTGPSGAGKSALALDLMALGARLVADDRVILCREGARVMARAPESIAGVIEARGVGLLRASPLQAAPVALVVELGRDAEQRRLPPARRIELNGLSLPYICGAEGRHLAPAVMQVLRQGMLDPDEDHV